MLITQARVHANKYREPRKNGNTVYCRVHRIHGNIYSQYVGGNNPLNVSIGPYQAVAVRSNRPARAEAWQNGPSNRRQKNANREMVKPVCRKG